jgi:hypothetical protein
VSITERYDALRELVSDAADFWRDLFAGDRHSGFTRWAIAGLPLDPTRLKAIPPDWLDRHPPTDTKRSSPFFPLITHGYYAENLAQLAARTLDLEATDVDALAKVHELRTKGWSSFEGRYGPKGMALALVAGVSVLAAQVPRQLFTRVGWDYGLYRILIFSVFAVAIILLGVLWLIVRADFGTTKRVDALLEAVLAHLAIMYARGDDPRKPSPGHSA